MSVLLKEEAVKDVESVILFNNETIFTCEHTSSRQTLFHLSTPHPHALMKVVCKCAAEICWLFVLLVGYQWKTRDVQRLLSTVAVDLISILKRCCLYHWSVRLLLLFTLSWESQTPGQTNIGECSSYLGWWKGRLTLYNFLLVSGELGWCCSYNILSDESQTPEKIVL